MNKEKLLSKENIKIAFDLFDQDGSGYISSEELKAVLGKGRNDGLSDDVWTSIMKEIDQNSDGQISFDEFFNVMLDIDKERKVLYKQSIEYIDTKKQNNDKEK